MAIYATAGQTIFNCSVGGQGTANGWTFTLPAGVADNDLFQISGDSVQFKSATTYYCRQYAVRVNGVNGGNTTLIAQTFIVGERGMRPNLTSASGLSYNSAIYSSLVNTSASMDCTVEFAAYIPPAGSNSLYSIMARGTSYLSSSAPSGTSHILALMISNVATPTVSLYALNMSGALQTLITASSAFGLTRSVWISVKITWTAAAATTVTLDINGTQVVAGTSSSYHLNLQQAAIDGGMWTGCSNGVANSGAPLMADLVITQNSYNVLTDPMTSQHANATLVGTPVFNLLN